MTDLDYFGDAHVCVLQHGFTQGLSWVAITCALSDRILQAGLPVRSRLLLGNATDRVAGPAQLSRFPPKLSAIPVNVDLSCVKPRYEINSADNRMVRRYDEIVREDFRSRERGRRRD